MRRLLAITVTLGLFAQPSLTSAQEGIGWTSRVPLTAKGDVSFANVASNPTTLVAAWRDFAGCDPYSTCNTAVKTRSSTDNGKTWKPVQTVAQQDYNESLDLAATNTSVVATWTSGPIGEGLTDLRIFRYTGDSWNESTTIESVSELTHGLQLAASDTSYYIVGGERQIVFTASHDDGLTWSPPTYTSVNSSSAWPDIGADGQLVSIVWGENADNQRGDIRVRTSTDGGQTFDEPMNLTTTDFYELCPSISVSGSAITAAWLARTGSISVRVSAARSLDGGQSWSTPTTVGDLSNDTALSYAGCEGRPVVLATNLGTEIFVRSGSSVKRFVSSDGENWTSVARPTDLDFTFFDVVEGDGFYHLVSSSDDYVFYSKGGPGLRPSGERTISLSLRGHLNATGSVVSPDPTCEKSIQIRIQRKVNNRWRTVTTLTSKPDRRYRKSIPDRTGKYQALATAERHCERATSPVKTHRH